MAEDDPLSVREVILHEAARLFVASGYSGLSMREIATAAGVSKAALYYHFRDKEALFLAILTRNLEHIEQMLAEARQAPTTRRQVEQMIQAIFDRAPEQRAIIRLASQEMGHLSLEARAEFNRFYHEKFIGQVEAILSAGIAHGELRPMDPSLATWLLLGMMYPFFYPAHAGEMSTPDAATALMVSIFFDGAAA
jgi:AcrR family transcriptional regulator